MTIDIICLIILFLGFYIGFNKGIIKAVFSVAAFMIAVLATFKLSPILIGVLKDNANIDPKLSMILGFLLTFMLFFVGIRLIGNLLEKGLKTVHLNIFNKISGASLYGVLALIVFSFTIYFTSQLHLLSEEQRASSKSYPYLVQIPKGSQEIVKALRPHFKSFWDQTVEAMDEIKEK